MNRSFDSRLKAAARMSRRALPRLTVVVAAILATACQGGLIGGKPGIGMPQITRLRTAMKPYAPRPDGYPIYLTEGDVKEAYEVLGTVQSRAYREDEVEAIGSSELQSGARELGGDAVIKIEKRPRLTEEVGYRPGALTRVGTRFTTHYVVFGHIVRFVRETPAAGP